MEFDFKRYAAIAASLAALYAGGAHAVPIAYQGTLQSYESATDIANADSGPFGDAAEWRFWRFDAVFGQSIAVVVQRLVGALDPVMGVWFGAETDTDFYFGDMSADSLFTTLVGFGDDELPSNLPGPGADALVRFIAPGTGTYVIAVADHSFDPTGASDLRYRVSLAIPEPASLALSAMALAALAFNINRK